MPPGIEGKSFRPGSALSFNSGFEAKRKRLEDRNGVAGQEIGGTSKSITTAGKHDEQISALRDAANGNQRPNAAAIAHRHIKRSIYKFVFGALFIFFLGLLAKRCESLQQLWDVRGVSGFSQRLDQVIHRLLVVRIAF